METQYLLTCINNSEETGAFVVFQGPQSHGHPEPSNAFSLAWLARPAHPGTRVVFRWNLDFCLMWSETGVLRPGVMVDASQILPVSPIGENSAQLAVDSFGAAYFMPPDKSGPQGSLVIKQPVEVVPNRMAVGMGMSGAGTYVVQAAPNITTVFTPRPTYWVAFGNYQAGQVLAPDNMTGAVEVTFPAAPLSRTVTLQPNNQLVVS